MESELSLEQRLALELFVKYVEDFQYDKIEKIGFFTGTNGGIAFTYANITSTLGEETKVRTLSIPTDVFGKLLTKYKNSTEEEWNEWVEANTLDLVTSIPSKLHTLLKEQGCDKLVNVYFNSIYCHDKLMKYVKVIGEFKKKFNFLIAQITASAKRINQRAVKRDHDLVLTFKATDDFLDLIVGLNVIPPKLPEGEEEIYVGDTPVSLLAWKDYRKVPSVYTPLKEVVVGGLKVSVLIKSTRRKVQAINKNREGGLVDSFHATLKEVLLSSSHFMDTVYKFETDDGLHLLDKVAGEILSVLDKYKTNIGLDLNEWVCYEYSHDRAPLRMMQPELDFREKILNGYTDSFITALYAYLLRVEHRAIKPYTNKTPVTTDDGVKIGEMRIA